MKRRNSEFRTFSCGFPNHVDHWRGFPAPFRHFGIPKYASETGPRSSIYPAFLDRLGFTSHPVLRQSNSQKAACIFRFPASHSCQVLQDARRIAPASVCVSPSAYRTDLTSAGVGLGDGTRLGRVGEPEAGLVDFVTCIMPLPIFG